LHRGSSISITMSLTVSRARRISQRIAIRMRRPAQRRLLNLAHFVLVCIRNREPQAYPDRSVGFVIAKPGHPAGTRLLGCLRNPRAVGATKIQAWQ
jgi:hypothetical protein